MKSVFEFFLDVPLRCFPIYKPATNLFFPLAHHKKVQHVNIFLSPYALGGTKPWLFIVIKHMLAGFFMTFTRVKICLCVCVFSPPVSAVMALKIMFT